MPTIAVVGGGFSGAAVAFHLARANVQAEIVVFEPRELLGAGLAYGGSDPAHRINVPASRMSLLPEDEAHFARWLEHTGVLARDPEARSGTEAFARRQDFGRYVDCALRPFAREGRLRHLRETVVDVRREDGWRVRTLSQEMRADLVVLATTHPTPSLPLELAGLADDARLICDGLADRALQDVASGERVLIVGAGLTAADIVATLDARAHSGPMVMISRHGLRSQNHPPAPRPAEGDFTTSPARAARELLRQIRVALREAEAGGRSWHGVVEALRVQGEAIWTALDVTERCRLVRHLRPYWDAHRFRCAPQVEALLERKLADGSLTFLRARLGEVSRAGGALQIELREGRRGLRRVHAFDRVAIATGPAHCAILDAQPYLQSLAIQGFVTMDPTGLGLATSREGRAIGAGGAPGPTLFVAGPLARGTFGELMGLPAVSVYAQFIADQIRARLA